MARLTVAGWLAAMSLLTMVVMLMIFYSRFPQHRKDVAFSEASRSFRHVGIDHPMSNAGCHLGRLHAGASIEPLEEQVDV